MSHDRRDATPLPDDGLFHQREQLEAVVPVPSGEEIMEVVCRTLDAWQKQAGSQAFFIPAIRDLHRYADRRYQAVLEVLPPAMTPPCAAGCSFCCYIQVVCTIPEVFVIAAHLRKTLPAAELAALLRRLIAVDDVYRGKPAPERSGVACPLLVDDRCSVYAVRPCACRGYHSTSLEICETSARFGNYKYQIPMVEALYYIPNGVMGALIRLLMENGIPDVVVELTGGLRIALETPDAMARWLSGDRLFEAAVSPDNVAELDEIRARYAHLLPPTGSPTG